MEPCKYESKILEISENIAFIRATTTALDKRINGSIYDIRDHIAHGSKWRISIIGVASALFITIITTVFWAGSICKQVEINTKILTKVTNGK